MLRGCVCVNKGVGVDRIYTTYHESMCSMGSMGYMCSMCYICYMSYIRQSYRWRGRW